MPHSHVLCCHLSAGWCKNELTCTLALAFIYPGISLYPKMWKWWVKTYKCNFVYRISSRPTYCNSSHVKRPCNMYVTWTGYVYSKMFLHISIMFHRRQNMSYIVWFLIVNKIMWILSLSAAVCLCAVLEIFWQVCMLQLT